jgi:hypothetical protein
MFHLSGGGLKGWQLECVNWRQGIAYLLGAQLWVRVTVGLEVRLAGISKFKWKRANFNTSGRKIPKISEFQAIGGKIELNCSMKTWPKFSLIMISEHGSNSSTTKHYDT